MTDQSSGETDIHRVAGIFRDVAHFEEALEALGEAGFGHGQISILGGKGELEAAYHGHVPPAEELADDPDAPRETLGREGGLKQLMDLIGDTAATLSMVAAAGAAFFVGGPIGVAAQASNRTDASVDAALEGFIDDAYEVRFKQNLQDGALVCWVDAADSEAATRAAEVLTAAGGDHVHEVPRGG